MKEKNPIEEVRLQSRLEETIFPSPNSVEFGRKPESEFSFRFGENQSHVAELYHENSKFSPSHALQPPTDFTEFEEARKWYFETQYRFNQNEIEPNQAHRIALSHADLPMPLAQLLSAFRESNPLSQLTYGVDVYLLYQHNLFRQVIGTDYLWKERTISSKENELIHRSLLHQPAGLPVNVPRILLVGVFWRYMMFFGPRGYRHTLFDCGALLTQLCGFAANIGFAPSPTYNFFDFKIDNTLQFDGVERSVLAAISLPPRQKGETNDDSH